MCNVMTSSSLFCVISVQVKRHLCCEDPVVVMNMCCMAPGPATLLQHHKYICLWPGTRVRIQMFGYSHTAERTFTTKTFMTRPVKCLNKLYIGFNLAASIKYELIPIDATKLLFARSQMVRLILAVGRYVGQHWYYYQGLYFITTYTVQLLSFLFNLLVVLVCRIKSIGRW